MLLELLVLDELRVVFGELLELLGVVDEAPVRAVIGPGVAARQPGAATHLASHRRFLGSLLDAGLGQVVFEHVEVEALVVEERALRGIGQDDVDVAGAATLDEVHAERDKFALHRLVGGRDANGLHSRRFLGQLVRLDVQVCRGVVASPAACLDDQVARARGKALGDLVAVRKRRRADETAGVCLVHREVPVALAIEGRLDRRDARNRDRFRCNAGLAGAVAIRACDVNGIGGRQR